LSGVATRDGWLQLAGRKGWAPLSSVDVAALAVAAAPSQEVKPTTTWETKAASHEAETKAPQARMQAQFSKGPAEEEADEEGEAKVCIGDWCVDFSNDTITREGRPQAFID